MNEQKLDEKSREEREGNIIIYRLKESTQADPASRVKEDTDFFKSLCTEALGITEIGTKSVIRLGKKPDDQSRPRPLKVSLSDKNDRQKIMGNLTKLKDAEPKFRNISVAYDLSLEERKKKKEKVLEAKKREEEESDGGQWTFRVRGPPWDLKIVRLKKRD